MSAFLKSGTGIFRVKGCDGYADTDIGHDLVPFDLIGLDDQLADSLRKRGRICRLLHLGHDDGEFVAAQTGNRIRLSGAATQTVGDQFQQLIADRMAKRIVDALELIEIEAKDRQAFAAFDAFEFVLQPLSQHNAIGQVGQRVMARHMSDPPFGALSFSDVLMGRQPTPFHDRFAHDRKCPAVGQMNGVVESFARGNAFF